MIEELRLKEGKASLYPGGPKVTSWQHGICGEVIGVIR